MQDVYYTFPAAQEPGEGETGYTVAMEQLDQYFTPLVNVPYERHLFRTMAQIPMESINQYIGCGYTYLLPEVSQWVIGLGWDQLGFPVR